MNAAAAPGAPGSSKKLEPLTWFADMVDHCLDHAEAARRQGRPIVGIMCEFTPRELILAAGGIPVCLCGGSAETIPTAEQSLPSNLCPLIKSTFGYHATGRNPFLKMADLVVAETTCDGKKKMFELMGETKPMYVLELPQKAEDADAFERWVVEVRKLKTFLEGRYAVTLTDERLREAITLMNRERMLRRDLASLMEADAPPLTGRELIEFRSIISGIEADHDQYARALSEYRETQEGERTPVARAQRKMRVLLTGVPLAHGAERVLELIESCGAVVVCQENCTGLKPLLEDVDVHEPDLIRAIARKYFHLPCSVMTLNQGRLDSIRELAGKFKPDCVIDLIWHACLTYDIESLRVQRLTEGELGLPFLKITTDYSPADNARIKARVEAMLEIARDRAARR